MEPLTRISQDELMEPISVTLSLLHADLSNPACLSTTPCTPFHDTKSPFFADPWHPATHFRGFLTRTGPRQTRYATALLGAEMEPLMRISQDELMEPIGDSWKANTRNPKPENRKSEAETENRNPETGNRNPETGNRNRKSESENRNPNSQSHSTRDPNCDDRVLDKPASGGEGSEGRTYLDCIRGKGVSNHLQKLGGIRPQDD